MRIITDLESKYPTTRVYRNDDLDFPRYSVKVGSIKLEDGSYHNIYKTVKFGKDAPEFDNETDIVIKDAFISGKLVETDNGNRVYEHIQVMDYEVAGELPFEEEVTTESDDDEWDD